MRLTRRWMAAASLGLLGTALLCVAEAAHAAEGTGRASMVGTVLGVGLGLVAAATYALYSWAAHRLITRRIPSGAAMGAVFGLGGLLLLPVLLATGAPLVASWSNAAVGTYMAIIPMFAYYVLFGWGLAHVPASTATTLSLLELLLSRPSSPSWSSANVSRPPAGPASPSSSPASPSSPLPHPPTVAHADSRATLRTTTARPWLGPCTTESRTRHAGRPHHAKGTG